MNPGTSFNWKRSSENLDARGEMNMPKFQKQSGKTFVRYFSSKVDFVCQGTSSRSWVSYRQTGKTVKQLGKHSSRSACVRSIERKAK